MSRYIFFTTIFAVIALAGCQRRAFEESVAGEDAMVAVSTPESLPEKKPIISDAAALESQGVGVTKNDDGSIKTLDFTTLGQGGTAWSWRPENIAEFSGVRVVRGAGLFEESLAETLSQMPRLTELLWTDAVTSDDALESVAKLKELKKVRLSGLQTTPQTAAILASFPALVDLDLSGSTVTDADMTPIYSAQKLTKLNLYQTQISDAGVENLRGIVRSLFPSNALPTRLVSLNLDATRVTDAGVETLSIFPALTFLHLGRTAITDAAVESLAKLTKLEKLHVTRTGVTDSGVARLREELPQCEIVAGTPEL